MTMTTTLKVDRYHIQGMSLGGLYTSLLIKELGILFDVGFAFREAASVPYLVLSHAHLDHIGALPALLGMRGMIMGYQGNPLKIICPPDTALGIQTMINAFELIHQWPLRVELIELRPDEIYHLGHQRYIKAIKTFHPVSSLGYLIFEKVDKLKPEFQHLSGIQIRDLKNNGIEITIPQDRYLLAYVTDTLIDVFKHHPELCLADVLICECTFWDQKKNIAIARAGCHIHLDELCDFFQERMHLDLIPKNLLLMHFSQLHQPNEIEMIAKERLKPILGNQLHLFLPTTNDWWC
jgi:ribonuclease Z